MAVLVWYFPFVEYGGIRGGYGAHIAQKCVKAFDFGQDGGAYAAFAAPEYDDAFLHI